MMTTIGIEGMTCNHCVASVTEELSEMAGVTSVSVELVAGGVSTAHIDSSEPLSEANLNAAISEAGYTAVPSTN